MLQATAVATVPSGNVYLYDGGNSGVVDAQHLILAVTGTLTTTVSSTAEFLAPGSLVVKKTITGPAGDHHGEIVIHTECDGIALTPDLVIPAGRTGRRLQPQLYGHRGGLPLHRDRDIRRLRPPAWRSS